MKFNLNYLELLNQVPSNIFWKDLNFVFLGCNNAFARIAGLNSPEEIVGKTDFDLVWGPTHGEIYQESDRRVLEGEIQTAFLETQVEASGRILVNIVNKVPLLDAKGKIVGVIGSYSEYLSSISSEVVMQKLNSYNLTKRELECAKLLIDGMSFKLIAAELSLSPRTVEHYIENIRDKLGVSNKSELIIKLMATIS